MLLTTDSIEKDERKMDENEVEKMVLPDEDYLTQMIRIGLQYQEDEIMLESIDGALLVGFSFSDQKPGTLTYTVAIGQTVMRFDASLNEIGQVVATPNPYPEDLFD